MAKQSQTLIQNYYQAFNVGDMTKMLSYLHDEIIHEVNQGKVQNGKAVFQQFLNHMNECYKESIADLVVMTNDSGKNAAAEFTVLGTYLKTDGTLPEARGQSYKIKAGAFFQIENDLITRVTTYYNLPQWIEMVK